MSTIKSSDEHLTLNADGSSKDIKFQANGVEKASISSAGAFTSTTIDATKLTGALPAISGAALTGVGVSGISSSADATAMTIDSSERIGFPNAPHAWNTINSSTAIRTLQLGQHTGLVGFDGKSTSLATNAYLSAGQPYNGTWKYVDSYNAQMIIADSGDYFFRAAPSGTAGNTISWSQTLKIHSDGRGESHFTARAWARISQTGTQSITMSHNCSSVSDNGTGDSSINFTNNIGSTQYCVTTGNAAENEWSERPNPTVTATNYVRLQNVNHSSTFRDSSRVHCVVYMSSE